MVLGGRTGFRLTWAHVGWKEIWCHELRRGLSSPVRRVSLTNQLRVPPHATRHEIRFWGCVWGGQAELLSCSCAGKWGPGWLKELPGTKSQLGLWEQEHGSRWLAYNSFSLRVLEDGGRRSGCHVGASWRESSLGLQTPTAPAPSRGPEQRGSPLLRWSLGGQGSHRAGPTLVTSAKADYLPKALPCHTIAQWAGRVSTQSLSGTRTVLNRRPVSLW